MSKPVRQRELRILSEAEYQQLKETCRRSCCICAICGAILGFYGGHKVWAFPNEPARISTSLKEFGNWFCDRFGGVKEVYLVGPKSFTFVCSEFAVVRGVPITLKEER